MSIRENIGTIRTRIAAACDRVGRQAHDVTLVVVTKTVGVDSIQEALEAGVVHFGENRVQDAIPKIDTFQAHQDLIWHMIGHLQTNKVKRTVEYFQKIHSLDSLKLAREVHKRAEQQDRVIELLFEVNVSGESSKFGLSPEDLPAVVREATQLDGIVVKGLMTMAPFVDDPEDTRPYFRKLRKLLMEFQDQGFSHMTELSMGMTNDFEIAVEEGATMVRVGSAIFGTRY